MQGFWAEVSTAYKKLYAALQLSPEEKEMAYSHVQFWRQPEYKACLLVKQAQVKYEIESIQTVDFLPLLSSALASKHFAALVKKTKVKTKGTVDEQALAEQDAESTNRVNDVVIVHLSKKRSLATFHAMFPLTVEERQHKVEWRDFLLSMDDAGFAIRNGGGPIVIFDHLHSTGKVNIHQPHPETTIDS